MYKIFPLIIFILSIHCMAQTNQTVHYYKDQYLNKEVVKEKASFSETITRNADTITTEVKKISTDEIVWSNSYKGDEPVGIWISGTKKLDYNFTIIYSDDTCSLNFSGVIIKDFFTDDISIGYIAPKVRNVQTSVNNYLMNQVRYPEQAKQKQLQGVSTISFTINAEGRIENITALKGSFIGFDKEAIRVINLLSFSSPAFLNGKPESVCITQKIKFVLSY